MRARVLDHPGSFRVAEVPDPTPQATEIVIRVECCGICGTDLHILAGEFPPTPYPITPGHEFAGTVVARGADVKPDLPIGARVAVDPSLYCGYCRRCRAGRDNLCENWAAIGDTVNGAFAEFVAVPAVNAYRLPDHLDGQADRHVRHRSQSTLTHDYRTLLIPPLDRPRHHCGGPRTFAHPLRAKWAVVVRRDLGRRPGPAGRRERAGPRGPPGSRA